MKNVSICSIQCSTSISLPRKNFSTSHLGVPRAEKFAFRISSFVMSVSLRRSLIFRCLLCSRSYGSSSGGFTSPPAGLYKGSCAFLLEPHWYCFSVEYRNRLDTNNRSTEIKLLVLLRNQVEALMWILLKPYCVWSQPVYAGETPLWTEGTVRIKSDTGCSSGQGPGIVHADLQTVDRIVGKL